MCIGVLVICSVRLSTASRQPNRDGRHSREALKHLKRSYNQPLLFVGEITALGPIFGCLQRRCRESVDFRIDEIVWGTRASAQVHASYINCTRKTAASTVVHNQCTCYCALRAAARD